MSTAEERAECVNTLVIYLEDLFAQPVVREAEARGLAPTLYLAMNLQDARAIRDELKQAKLDRARLALLEGTA